MFEKPSDPRSKSYDKRMQVFNAIKGVAELKQHHIDNLVAKELRETIYILDKARGMADRQWRIRTEQSHRMGQKNGS